jgi:hypothetical protein
MADLAKSLDVGGLSSGAISLLALAAGAFDDRSRQRRRDISNGAALQLAWDVCGALPAQSASFLARRSSLLLTWMNADEPPPNLFLFCGWLADGLHQRICGRHSSLPKEEDWFPTGFDHSVYLALGQSLAHFLGMADGTGPDFDTVVARTAKLVPAALQREFLRNYLGNVMQDYFDAAQIRKKNPRLPPTTEPDLRRVDGAVAADLVFAAIGQGDEPVPWPAFYQAFRSLLGAVFLAERDLYDRG